MRLYLNIPALDTIVSEYKKDAETVQNKIGCVSNIMNTLDESAWSGDDADRTRNSVTEYQKGKMTPLQQQVNGVGRIMSTLLIDCRTYKGYCNHFTDILESDSFPCLQESDSIGGYILCDGDEIAAAKAAATSAAGFAAEIKGFIAEAENELAGLEFGDSKFNYQQYTQPIKQQADDVNLRMTDYATALQNYFDGCETADNNAKGMLDGECPEIFATEADPDIILKIRKEAAKSSLDANAILEAEELAKKDKNGRYGFEDIMDAFNKDGKISDVDAKELALLYLAVSDNIELAESDSQAGTSGIIFKAMLKGLYKVDATGQAVGNFYGKNIPKLYRLNQNLLSLIMNNLPQKNGIEDSVAYISLTRLQENVKNFYSYNTDETNPIKVNLNYSNPAYIGITLTCTTSDGDQVMSIGVTGYRRSAKYVEQNVDLKRAEYLQLSKDSIIRTLMYVANDTDVKVLTKLVEGKYDEAFSVNPDKLSDYGTLGLGAYSAKVQTIPVSWKALSEISNIANGIFKQDVIAANYGYTQKYLDKMTVSTGIELNSMAASVEEYFKMHPDVMENKSLKDALVASAGGNSFWLSLDEAYTDEDSTLRSDYEDYRDYYFARNGSNQEQPLLFRYNLKDLKYDESNGSFTYEIEMCDPKDNLIKDTDGKLVCPARKFGSNMVFDSLSNETDYNNEKAREIQKEINNLGYKYTVKTAMGLVGLVCPEAGLALEGAATLTTGEDANGTIKDGVKMLASKGVLEGGKATIGTANCVGSLWSGIEEYQKLEAKKNATYLQTFRGMFLSGSQYETDHYKGTGYEAYNKTTSETVCKFETLREKARWEQQGIGGVIYQYNENADPDDKANYKDPNNEKDQSILTLEEAYADQIMDKDGDAYVIKDESDNAKACMIFGKNNLDSERFVDNNKNEVKVSYESLTQVSPKDYSETVESFDKNMQLVDSVFVTQSEMTGIESMWNSNTLK